MSSLSPGGAVDGPWAWGGGLDSPEPKISFTSSHTAPQGHRIHMVR